MLIHSLFKMPKDRFTTAPGNTTGARGQMVPLHPWSGSRNGDGIFLKDTIVLILRVGKPPSYATAHHFLHTVIAQLCVYVCLCVHVGVFLFIKGWDQCLPKSL